jgi:hypothetical protein
MFGASPLHSSRVQEDKPACRNWPLGGLLTCLPSTDMYSFTPPTYTYMHVFCWPTAEAEEAVRQATEVALSKTFGNDRVILEDFTPIPRVRGWSGVHSIGRQSSAEMPVWASCPKSCSSGLHA